MTRQQKKAVRKALRQYGRKQKAADAAGCAAAGPDPWGRVIRQVLHIGRTTYYHKELETLSTAAVFAAKAGLI